MAERLFRVRLEVVQPDGTERSHEDVITGQSVLNAVGQALLRFGVKTGSVKKLTVQALEAEEAEA